MATDVSLNKTDATETGDAERTRHGRCYRPNCDILETSDEIMVVADIPGAAADNFDIKFEDGMLSIHAKIDPRQPGTTQFLLTEYGVGDFYRTFRVSEAIDVSRISADLNNGVLTLHLPKAEAAKPRKIEVRA